MMFNKLASVVSTLLLAGSVYAGQEQSCPDISDIKAEGMTMVAPIMYDQFLTYNISSYKTDNKWAFVIAPIEAESEDVALELANDLLNGMGSVGIPQTEPDDEIVCMYNTGDANILAAAVNADHMISPSKLKQYIQKAR